MPNSLANRLRFTTTATSVATISSFTTVAKFFTPAQSIAAGEIAVGLTRFPLTAEDDAGNVECSYYTIGGTAQAPTFTRTSVYRSTNNNQPVTFSGTVTVTHDPFSDYLSGISVMDLPIVTSVPAGAYVELTQADGTAVRIAGSNFATGSSSSAATVTGVAVSPSTVSVTGAGTQTFTATVSGTNSPSQSVTWAATAGSITSGGVFTAPASTASAQTITITATSVFDSTKSGAATVTVPATGTPTPTVSSVTVSPTTASLAGGAAQQFSATVTGTNSPSQSVTWSSNIGTINSAGLYTAPAATGSTQSATITATSVADNTKSGTATVSIAAAGVQTISVNTPATQTVGTAYNVTGTYANGTPTALDYSIDSGSTWTAATSPTISGGTYSFSVTPSTASASRTMMVRDHTTLVSGTSGTYVVNAAASTYTVTGYGTTPNAPRGTLDMSAAQVSGGKKYVLSGAPFTDGSGYFIVKNGGTQVANGTTGIYAGWSKDPANPPATTLTGGTPNTGANNVAAFTQMSVNATAAQVTAYFWATPGTDNGNWYLWFKFPDGSTYCFNPAAPLVVSGA